MNSINKELEQSAKFNEFIKKSYEKKLGISGIAIGKDRYVHIVPSPLAEYITD